MHTGQHNGNADAADVAFASYRRSADWLNEKMTPNFGLRKTSSL